MEMIIDLSSPSEKQAVLDALRELNGMHRITVVKYRQRRTDAQNRYYWPCVVRPFGDFLREQGEGYTDEMAHEFLKFKFLRQTVPNLSTGEVVGERIRSTTELNTEEFAEYLEHCIAYLAETFGIEVAVPNTETTR